MDADKVDLLGEGEWHGLFHPPSDESATFLGRLRYSATRGTSLEYMVPGSARPQVSGVLHGMLEGGQAVTLFSQTPMSPVIPSMKGGFERLAGWIPLTAFCVGEYFEEEPLVSSISFTVSGLDEFLASDPATRAPSWPSSPAVVHQLPDGTLEVRHAMRGTGISRLSQHLMHPNPSVLAQLDTVFQSVRQQHPDEWFMLRTALEPALSLMPCNRQIAK